MHSIEPYYLWRDYYIASEDPQSPFFEREYSEFEFHHSIYNFVIHPQWDYFGSNTLFMKALFVDYEEGYAILEFIGEWNDAIENDIMTLKREILEEFIGNGISKFVLIGENVLNFHYSDDSYYEEWFEEVEDGWIALINFHDHVLREIKQAGIDQYLISGGELDDLDWRTHAPRQCFKRVAKIVDNRLLP